MKNDEYSGMIITDPFGNSIELTKKQSECVNFQGEKTNLVVKGAAGSGKSVVLMGKAVKYLKEYSPDKKNGIIVFTYTNSLTNYAKEFLDPTDTKSNFIRVCTLDSYILEIAKELEWRPDYPLRHVSQLYDEKEKTKIVEKLLKTSKVEHRFFKKKDIESELGMYSDFWVKEFQWMMDLGISGNRTPTDHAYYISRERKGRGHVYNMSLEDRNVAYDFFCDYQEELKKNRYVEPSMIDVFVNNNRNLIPDEMKYEHVLVDEAQDLPLIDMSIAKSLSKGDVIFAMDANQRLYRHHWTMTELGIPSTTKKLNKSFRCTVQIDKFAEILRRINESYLDKDDIYEHITPESDGPLPLVIKFDDKDMERRHVTNLVKRYLRDDRTRTAIIVHRRGEVDEWSEWFSSIGIEHEVIRGNSNHYRHDIDNGSSVKKYSTRSPGLKICTIHSAKGLEFHNVIIPSFTQGKFPMKMPKNQEGTYNEDEWNMKFRNLSYVAMTRAQFNLVVTYYKHASIYLKEIFKTCGVPEGRSCNMYNFLYMGGCNTGEIPPDFIKIPKNDKKMVITKKGEPEIYIPIVKSAPISDDEDDNHVTTYVSLTDHENFEELLKKARNKEPNAILQVARCYRDGTGVAKNARECMKWYSKISNQLPEAQYDLSIMYGDGNCVDKNLMESLIFLKKSANGYYLPALLELIEIYQKRGKSLENEITVFELKALLAECGDMQSQIELAHSFKDGNKYVRKNMGLYIEWLISAYENGSINAKAELDSYNNLRDEFGHTGSYDIDFSVEYNLDDLFLFDRSYSEKIEQELPCLKSVIKNIIPFFRIIPEITLHENSLYFVYSQDMQSICNKYFRSLKHQSNNPENQYRLALCYLNGYGTIKDDRKTFKWLERSSTNGYLPATYAIAKCYGTGFIVAADFKKYTQILLKLSDEGFSDATLDLGKAYEINDKKIKDFNKSCYFYAKAAKQKNVKAYFEFAWCLEMGKGLDCQDFAHAKYWYMRYNDEIKTERGKNALLRLENIEASETMTAHFKYHALQNSNSS